MMAARSATRVPYIFARENRRRVAIAPRRLRPASVTSRLLLPLRTKRSEEALQAIGALVGEIVTGDVAAGFAWASLALAASAIGLAGARTVRNAVRLGTQADDAATQSALARRILGDHVACFAAIAIAIGLQVAA